MSNTTKQRVMIAVGVFFLACVLFSYIQFSTEHILGVDGYYHITAADIIRNEGFIEEQSWWQYSITKNVDLYVLFHYLLVPFTFLGLVFGAKVYTVVGASLTLTCMYLWLDYKEIRYAYVYPFFAFISSYMFLYRFSLPRAYLLTIPILFVGYWLCETRRYWALFGLAVFFTLLYSAFPTLIALVWIYCGIRLVQTKKINIKLCAMPLLGSLVGLLINPYFPQNLKVSWAQIVEAILVQNTAVLLPSDSLPYSVSEFIYVGWVVLLIFTTALVLLYLQFNAASGKSVMNKIASLPHHTLVFAALAGISFILALQHKRSIEYWFPFSTLFFASALNDYLDSTKKAQKWFTKNIKMVGVVVGIILVGYGGMVVIPFAESLPLSTQQEGLFGLNECADFVAEYSEEGELIFTPWDITPPLHFYNRKNTYLVGMDPLFMYNYDSGLYAAYSEIMYTESEDPATLISELFGARFVILDGKRSDLAKYFLDKGRFKPLKASKHCIVMGITEKQPV